MRTVEAIYTAPVKSLGLVRPETVRVDFGGIIEDRRFYLVASNGALLTQRQIGPLVQVTADYRAEPEWLRLEFPGGNAIDGPVEVGERIVTRIWGATGSWACCDRRLVPRPVRLLPATDASSSLPPARPVAMMNSPYPSCPRLQ